MGKLSACVAPGAPTGACLSLAGALQDCTWIHAVLLQSQAPFLCTVLPSGRVKEINSSV